MDLQPIPVLSEDIYFNISAALDDKDICAFREASRVCCSAIKRRFWTSLLRGFIRNYPENIHLDREITDMSWQDMRQQYIAWRSARQAWKSAASKPEKIRPFTVHYLKQDGSFHFVLGGEWLIAVDHSSGEVTYFNLHAENETIHGETLIARQSEGRSHVKFDISHLELPENRKDFYGFRIAFSFTSQGSSTTRDLKDLHEIWTVTPVHNVQTDPSHQVYGLTAQLDASFPHHPKVDRVTSISLFRSRVAFSALYGVNQYTCVVDWKEEANRERNDSNSDIICSWLILESTIVTVVDNFPPDTYEIHLLPLTWALCKNGETLVIYDLTENCPMSPVFAGVLPKISTELTEKVYKREIVEENEGDNVFAGALASMTRRIIASNTSKVIDSTVLFFAANVVYGIQIVILDKTLDEELRDELHDTPMTFLEPEEVLGHIRSPIVVATKREDIWPVKFVSIMAVPGADASIPAKLIIMPDEYGIWTVKTFDSVTARVVLTKPGQDPSSSTSAPISAVVVDLIAA